MNPGSDAKPRGIPVWAWILMALVVVFGGLLFLMALAIPSLNSAKKRANEMAAIARVHTIMTAEITYSSTYPDRGYACSISTLGGDARLRPPTADAAELIPGDLATGYKDGYIYGVMNCSKDAAGGSGPFTGFMVTATPQAPGKTGDRGFCVKEDELVRFDPAGGTNCTQPLE